MTPPPPPAAVPPPAAARPAVPPTPSSRRGFTLLEVMIAMSLLLVGGVSVLAVFTLAVGHQVASAVERRLDLVVPQVAEMAQRAVNEAKDGAPAPIVKAPTSQLGFTVSIVFRKSPNGDAAWVALAQVFYQDQPFDQGVLKPIFLRSAVYAPPR